MLTLGVALLIGGGAAFAVASISYVRAWMQRAPHPRVQSKASSVFDAVMDVRRGWIRRPGGAVRKPVLLAVVGYFVMALARVLVAPRSLTTRWLNGTT